MKEYQETFESMDSCVITAFKTIYKTMTDLDVTPIKPVNMNDFVRNYSTTMGLNGFFTNDKNEKVKFKGNAVISWQLDGYLKMASRIMGEEYTEFCADVNDVGMEVLNTAVGNSKALLGKNNIFIGMSLPTAYLGNQFFMERSQNIFSETHVFDTSVGKLCIIVNCLIDL